MELSVVERLKITPIYYNAKKGVHLFFVVFVLILSDAAKPASITMPSKMCKYPYSVSGNKVRVCYHLCIRHTFDMVLELHQSSENTHCYFHIIKDKNTYRLSFAV